MTDTTAGEGFRTKHERITRAELVGLFGETMPVDAVGIIADDSLSLSEARNALADLAAQPSAGAQGEVVAWRCKMAADDEWELCFSDPRCDTSDFAQVQPLYATPAQPDTGDVAALRERVARVLMLYELDSDGDWPADKVSLALEARDAEHSGDCTGRPWTCMRCACDDVYKRADAILAALSKPNAPGREG